MTPSFGSWMAIDYYTTHTLKTWSVQQYRKLNFTYSVNCVQCRQGTLSVFSVCFFILFHLLTSSICKTSVTYLRCTDQRSCVFSVAWCFCQVLNLSYFTSKDETPASTNWRENDMIYGSTQR